MVLMDRKVFQLYYFDHFEFFYKFDSHVTHVI